jgi:glutaminyl-peptide cyclotransferase
MVRMLAFCLLSLAACAGDSQDTSGTTTLPPGMVQPGGTNADAPPPAIPFSATTPVVRATVVQRFPHDTGAYTQGLVLSGSRLFESTGRYAQSDVREVTITTGAVVRRTRLDDRFFAEGLAFLNGRLVQLTWREGTGFRYDPATLAVVDSFAYNGEGWGLASDGTRFYGTDGSSRVSVLAAGWTVERSFTVTEGGKPVPALNELEWVNGELWSNVFQTDYIARIDPTTGAVKGYLDMSGLLTKAERDDVARRGGTLNGIAFDAASGRLLVTGKLWPAVFQIRVP